MMLVKYLALRQVLYSKLQSIKKLKAIKLLKPILQKYCIENFQNSSDISSKLSEYKKLLLDSNQNMNLIGKSTIDDFDQRHFLDCIQIVKYLPHPEKSLMDIGTGAGLPGIIMSIIGFKNLHLVEKSPKKSIFLENCKLRLGLNYQVHNKPIADISNLNVDCITARAFASIEKIISMTKQIINKQTKFILLKGRSYLKELQAINPQKYFWETYPSITSHESKIIIMGAK